MEIPSATSADAGTYTCVLVNESGRTECSCEVSVCVPPLLSFVHFCTETCILSFLSFGSVYRYLILVNLIQVTVEHYSNDHETPPAFVKRLEDLTVMDGDEVTLSVTLSGRLLYIILLVWYCPGISPAIYEMRNNLFKSILFPKCEVCYTFSTSSGHLLEPFVNKVYENGTQYTLPIV